MSVSIDWGARIIYVPKAYLTFLGGTTYSLNVNTFRLTLKDLEDDVEGMPFPDTHRHNTEVVLGGLTLSRVVEIINGYTITFENGIYSVSLTGANNNIIDVVNLNSVSIRSANSAGMITIVSGSGVTEQDKLDIADRVWDELATQHNGPGTLSEIMEGIALKTVNLPNDPAKESSLGALATQSTVNTIAAAVELVLKIQKNRWKIQNNQMIIYDDNGNDPIVTLNLKNAAGAPSMTEVYERTPV